MEWHFHAHFRKYGKRKLHTTEYECGLVSDCPFRAWAAEQQANGKNEIARIKINPCATANQRFAREKEKKKTVKESRMPFASDWFMTSFQSD